MTITLNMPRTINRKLLAGLALYATLAVIGLREYVDIGSINFLLGMIALCLVFSSRTGPLTNRFAWVAVAFAVLAWLLPVKTFLYFSVGAAVLFLIESTHGSQGGLPLVIIGLMAPVFKYFVNVFSFPIRLQLTAWAGKLLSVAGTATDVKGNMIFTRNGGFSVDPECMGLNMMTTSLVLGIMLVALYQQQFARRLALWQTGIVLLVIALLNIVCNLFRIVCLVQFELLPDTLAHDLAGLACLLVYVVIPALYITQFSVRRLGLPASTVQTTHTAQKGYKHWLLHSIVAAAVCAATFAVVGNGSAKTTAGQLPSLQGFKASRVKEGVLKLENSNTLVYVKPIRGFYNTDHHPMICWTGSGYLFEQVRERIVNGETVYTAVLNNGGSPLHTAWWYDNGSGRTTQQLKWRWDMLRGAQDYSLVNITVATEAALEPAILALQNNGSFNAMLKGNSHSKGKEIK